MDNPLDYKSIKPDKSLSDFVACFWLLRNPSASDKEVVILPDGQIDLFFSPFAIKSFHVTLLRIETLPDQAKIIAGTIMFAISLKLLAPENIFYNTLSNLLNTAENLPVNKN